MANEFKVKKGLVVDGSGTVVDIQGTAGQLFSVTDSLTGDLFSVSDVSGVPILNVNSSGTVKVDGVLNVNSSSTLVIDGTVDSNIVMPTDGDQIRIGTFTDGSSNSGEYANDDIVIGEGGSISIFPHRRGDYGLNETGNTSTTFRSKLNIWSDNQDHITFGGAHTKIRTAWEHFHLWINNDSADAGLFRLYNKSSETEFARLAGEGSSFVLENFRVKQTNDTTFNSGLTVERSSNTQKVHIGMDGGAVNFNSPDGLSYKFRNNTVETFTLDGNGYGIITNRLQVGKAGGASNSGRLDLFGRYSSGTTQPTIYFKTDHPSNSTQWDMAQINAGDGGNYNGQLYFKVASGSGSAGNAASLATALFIDDTKDATFYGNIINSGTVTSNGTGTSKFGGDVRLESGTNGTTAKIIFKTTDNTDTSKFIRTNAYWNEYGAHKNEGHKFIDSDGTILLQLNGGNSTSGNGALSATFGGNITAIVGSSHSFLTGNTNNLSTADTVGFRLHQSSYTDGRYTHRFRKRDMIGGVPLYLDFSSGTANVFSNLVRFGKYSGEVHDVEVNGNIKATFANTTGYQIAGTYIVDSSRNLVNINNATASQLTIDDYIYHAGDPDTYIYFTTDNIKLRAGGDDRLELATTYAKFSNNVSIATSSTPRYQLDLAKLNDAAQTDYLALGVNNGPSSGIGTAFGTGLVWKANYSGYTKRSAGIVQTAEGNYFRSGLAFFTNNQQSSSSDWVERMRLNMDGKLTLDPGAGVATDGTVLDVKGSEGQLFSVTNSLTGDLFSVADVSGVPILNVNSSGLVTIDDELELTNTTSGQIILPDSRPVVSKGTDGVDNAILMHNGTRTFLGSATNSATLYVEGNNTTLAGDITVNGGDVNVTKQDDAPTFVLTHDGANPGTSDHLWQIASWVDYNGTHQNWGNITHRTTSSSSVRTELLFDVKSQSGNLQNALILSGGSARPTATFAGNVTFQEATNTYSSTVGKHPNFTQYAGLWSTKGQANNASRYMIINAAESDGYRTYVGGDEVYIRPGINSTTGQLIIRTTGATFAGAVTATSFSGDGSNLTNLPAGSAPTNMVTTNTTQTISGAKTFSSTTRCNGKLELGFSVNSSGSQFETPDTVRHTFRCDSDQFRIWMGGGSGETLTVDQQGRVGIKKGSPAYTLDVNGNVSNISIYASHDVAAYSDARVKTDVETIPNALYKVNKLRGVTFKRTDEGSSDKRMMGVIAQEVLDIIPEVVNKRESDGHYSVSYGNIVGVLIEAVKELTVEVEELKKQIK